ncbi:hypothetical protein P3T76_005896 [Phytophthora citrophthora]|uniref:AWS domain-containing protein n=1 Tax=Phytophthora citrophthora TaxID=4793 RepID=A0AAD9LP58_9STRA|nr:hypothetical protein P3T76_005896 [Phytophthora citrophthora]
MSSDEENETLRLVSLGNGRGKAVGAKPTNLSGSAMANMRTLPGEYPSSKRNFSECFRSVASCTGEDTSARKRSKRSKKDLPPPTRLNYIVHKVVVRPKTEPILSPHTSPDTKAMTVSSPLSAFAHVAQFSSQSVSQSRTPLDAESFVTASIKFAFVHHFGDCGCDDPCEVKTCRNARMNIFCKDGCCVWEELCGNRPRESPKVAVKQDADTLHYAIVATVDIKVADVLGEYLGQLHIVSKDASARPRNQGFALSMRARSDHRNMHVGIDAIT